MYKVIVPFVDLTDNGFLYTVGAVYPRTGVQPAEERIQQLATNDNKQGKPLIEAIAETPKPVKKRRKKYEDN